MDLEYTLIIFVVYVVLNCNWEFNFILVSHKILKAKKYIIVSVGKLKSNLIGTCWQNYTSAGKWSTVKYLQYLIMVRTKYNSLSIFKISSLK